jgi:uncharacterized protein (TIGR00266 family)
MAALSSGIEVKTGTGGGVTKGLMRKALGGESFFLGRYLAKIHGAWVAVAPKYPGDIITLDVDDSHSYMTQTGSMLALGDGVSMDVRASNLTNILSREGITMLRLHGQGKAVLCSYGGLQHFDLEPGQQMIVDTGHLVAYSDGMSMHAGFLSGFTTAATTGEGLVAQLVGPGEVFMQTRAEAQLRNWLIPERAQNDSGGNR